VEGFGEASPPQNLHFLVVIAGEAGNDHQKGKILGGPMALQTSHQSVDCVNPVIKSTLFRRALSFIGASRLCNTYRYYRER
jgi:hypothetical protein